LPVYLERDQSPVCNSPPLPLSLISFTFPPELFVPPLLAVFDLDGTLIDTHHDLVDSLNYTIAVRDLEPLTYADLTHLVGSGARAMIERAFKLRGSPIADGDLEAMIDRFVEHYRAGMPGKSLPYPGLVEALDRLADAGVTLAVCTNKMEGLARPLLDLLGLSDRFAAVTGGDTFAVRKPDAEHLLGTIRMAGGEPSHTVMIGDSLNDFKVAANAGVPSIGVPFGYSDVGIETLNPTVIIQHFDELTPGLVERLVG
jgi:phosphoglycolate phosphatase